MKKRTFLMLSASALMAAGLAGCQKDRNGGVEEQGDPTTATLNLTFTRQSQTRATSDPNATDAEAAIKSVDVFIYTEGGAYLQHEALAPTDFTGPTNGGTADTYTGTKQIATTTGVKNFLVGVNLPAGTATALENKPMSTAQTVAQTIQRTAINVTNGLPMFSTVAKAVSLQPTPTANKVTVEVKRLVAKVTVEQSATMSQEGNPGKLGKLQWAINNQNTKYYLLQGNAPSYPDPNWARGSYIASDFQAATDTDYIDAQVNTGTPLAITDYTPQYALENTSDDKTQKELTRVTVRATFIPGELVTAYVQGSKTVTKTDNSASNTVATFYTVTASAGAETYYFDNQTNANNYATDMGVTAKTFTNGMVYWNFFLNTPKTGQVERNDFYKCSITRVVAPGNTSADLASPDAQPTSPTNVDVVVNVVFWNTPVLEDKELVP